MPFEYTVSDIVDQVRNFISDPKIIYINAVDESPAQVLDHTPANWGKFLYEDIARGRNHEIFATKNMPLLSGCAVKIKGDRWNYRSLGDYVHPYIVATPERVFFIDYYQGLFVIPSGATLMPSGGKVSLTYTWEENQEYRYSDEEVKKFIPEGYNYLSQRYTPPYTLSGRGNTLSFDTAPIGVDAFLLSFASSYMMRASRFEEEISEGISVRDGDTAFDTTKKLAHRGKSLDKVKEDLDAVIDMVVIGDLNGAGIRIDSYSTLDFNPQGIGYYQEYRKENWSSGI